jgi:hypothetical protein
VTTYTHFSFIIYKVRLVVLVSIDLNQWDLICFVGMNAVMGWRTTIKTPTTQGQNKVVWPTFPWRGYTHGPMWSKSPSTIEPTLDPMENLPMVHVIRNPQNKCLCMFCVSQKLKDFIWTQLGLGYTMKQIYDKHKKIWWAHVNVGKWMTRDDFLKHNLLRS